MTELKTQKNAGSVEGFLNSVDHDIKRADCFQILEMMKEITGEEPKMWGESMIGFGEYHYRYASGHEGDAALVGFSPRKQNITLYLMGCYVNPEDKTYDELFSRLGKHKTGKSCLYINKLSDVNLDVLRDLIRRSYLDMKNLYPSS